MKTYLMTGHRGVVGSALVKSFNQSGHKLFYYDKNREVQADCCLHLAGKFTNDVNRLIDSNINFMNEVIEYCKKCNIRKLIFFSGAKAYGNWNREHIKETETYLDPDIYGLSKLFGEKMLEMSGLECLVLRFPGILTPESKTGFLSMFYHKLICNEDIILTNANKIFNNFVFIDDIFKFLVNIKIKKSFDVINLAVDHEITLMDIVSIMKEKLRSTSKIIVLDKDQNFFNLSIEKAKSEYGFKPTPAKQSIIDWLNQRINND